MEMQRGPRKKDNFTMLGNDLLNDHRLSFRARGLLAHCLSKPEGWKFSAERLATQAKEGRDAIRTCIRELEDAGYLVRRQWRDQGSQQWKSTWILHEEPQRIPSDGVDPQRISSAGLPAPDNQATVVSTKASTKEIAGSPDETTSLPIHPQPVEKESSLQGGEPAIDYALTRESGLDRVYAALKAPRPSKSQGSSRLSPPGGPTGPVPENPTHPH